MTISTDRGHTGLWFPKLSNGGGPKYLAIASALEDDIDGARLAPGSRLPTHRELADQLGVTVGTVTRAYAEAERRGLIAGHVGRGTFVRPIAGVAHETNGSGSDPSRPIDLSLNLPMPGGGEDRALAAALARIIAKRDTSELLRYGPHAGMPSHRAAAAAWMRRFGADSNPDQVVLCSGTQHAMTVVLTAITKPGDLILTEYLAYPGLRRLAGLLNLRLKGLPMDEHGIKPEALEAECRRGAKVLFCVPTLHNPTAIVSPEARRKKIAAIAKARDLMIIEDDVYGSLPLERPKPIAALAPERCFYIASASKSMAPGLRLAFVSAPRASVTALEHSIASTIWMAPPLLAEVASGWIEDGTADRLLEQKRTEASARQAIAARVLKDQRMRTHSHSFHLWLELPDRWRNEDFVARAREAGVIVSGASAFFVGDGKAPNAVRLCLGGAARREDLERGLALLTGLIERPPAGSRSII